MTKPAHISPVIWPERMFQYWTTRMLVPHALTKPADKFAVFVVIQACGNNRAFAVLFSLS